MLEKVLVVGDEVNRTLIYSTEWKRLSKFAMLTNVLEAFILLPYFGLMSGLNLFGAA